MNTNRNIITYNVPNECLLNNIIDEDLQAALFPLSMCQKISLTAHYKIRNNFITPNTKKDYLKSFIGAAVSFFAMFYRFNQSGSYFGYAYTPILLILIWFDFIYYSLTVIIIYIESALQSTNSIMLLIKLQRALHTINLDKATFFSEMKFWNWIHIICLFGFYWVFNLPILLNTFHFSIFVIILPVLLFDLNIIYASRTVAFVSNCLAMWNDKMVYNERALLRQIEVHVGDDVEGAAIANAYFDIVKTFYRTEKVYGFGILNHVAGTFCHVLICIQTFVEFSKVKTNVLDVTSPILWSFASVWVIKNIVLLISLSSACNKFYKNVAEADAICTKLLLIEDSGLTKTCKNVLRFNCAWFRPMRACGVFAVDAALPLRLLATVLGYTVVLLQFAFL